jgi:hypothetical protein
MTVGASTPLWYCAALFLSWNSLKRFDSVVYTSARQCQHNSTAHVLADDEHEAGARGRRLQKWSTTRVGQELCDQEADILSNCYIHTRPAAVPSQRHNAAAHLLCVSGAVLPTTRLLHHPARGPSPQMLQKLSQPCT